MEKDGSNIEIILQNGVRLLQSAAMGWLDQYSGVEYALAYLRRKDEKDAWLGGPYGFGGIGSPMRNRLIQQLEEIH